MSRYDVRAAREAVRRSLGRVHPLTVSGDLGELQGQLPVVFPRHLLAVYRLAHLAALQGLVLADRRVLVRGRLSRRQRLTAAHPQVRGDRRYPPLGRITEPARIAAAVYDEVLWQFPHRAGRLAYAEALACPEGSFSKPASTAATRSPVGSGATGSARRICTRRRGGTSGRGHRPRSSSGGRRSRAATGPPSRSPSTRNS